MAPSAARCLTQHIIYIERRRVQALARAATALQAAGSGAAGAARAVHARARPHIQAATRSAKRHARALAAATANAAQNWTGRGSSLRARLQATQRTLGPLAARTARVLHGLCTRARAGVAAGARAARRSARALATFGADAARGWAVRNPALAARVAAARRALSSAAADAAATLRGLTEGPMRAPAAGPAPTAAAHEADGPRPQPGESDAAEAGGGGQLARRDLDARARSAAHGHGASSVQPGDELGQAAEPAACARSNTAPPHARARQREGAQRIEAETLMDALVRAALADAHADSGRPGGGVSAPGARAAAPAAAGAGGRSQAALAPAAGADASPGAAVLVATHAPAPAAACQPEAHSSGGHAQEHTAAGAELGVGQSLAPTPPSPAARPLHPPPTCLGEGASSHDGAPEPWSSPSREPPVAQHTQGAEGGAGSGAAQRAGSPAARAAPAAAEPAEASGIAGGGRPALAPGGTLAARPVDAALQAAGLPGFGGRESTLAPRPAGSAPGGQPGGPARLLSAGPAGASRWGAALAAALVAAVAGAAAALPALAAVGRSLGRRASRGMPPGLGLEPAHAAGAPPPPASAITKRPLASASAPAGVGGARRAAGLAPVTASEAARLEATPRARTLRMSAATGAEA